MNSFQKFEEEKNFFVIEIIFLTHSSECNILCMYILRDSARAHTAKEK